MKNRSCGWPRGLLTPAGRAEVYARLHGVQCRLASWPRFHFWEQDHHPRNYNWHHPMWSMVNYQSLLLSALAETLAQFLLPRFPRLIPFFHNLAIEISNTRGETFSFLVGENSQNPSVNLSNSWSPNLLVSMSFHPATKAQCLRHVEFREGPFEPFELWKKVGKSQETWAFTKIGKKGLGK